jgi:hypothetical protein
VEYSIPLEKAREVHSKADTNYFAPGLLSDPALLIRPAFSTPPFVFPFPSQHDTLLPLLMDEYDRPRIPYEGIQRVVGLPRVFGLHDTSGIYARVNRLAFTATTFNETTHPSMMDGGTNICVRGILGLLVNISSIPPLLITVPTKSHQHSIDDCCTKRGYLPLMLNDSSVYYQICYYCANMSETIILPNAILQLSNILTH